MSIDNIEGVKELSNEELIDQICDIDRWADSQMIKYKEILKDELSKRLGEINDTFTKRKD